MEVQTGFLIFSVFFLVNDSEILPLYVIVPSFSLVRDIRFVVRYTSILLPLSYCILSGE